METGKRVKIALLAGAGAALLAAIVWGAYAHFYGSVPNMEPNLRLFADHETTLQWELSRWFDIPAAFIWGYALVLLGARLVKSTTITKDDSKSAPLWHIPLTILLGMGMAAASIHGLIDGLIMAGGYIWLTRNLGLMNTSVLAIAMLSGLAYGLASGLASMLPVLLIVTYEVNSIVKSETRCAAAQEESQHTAE